MSTREAAAYRAAGTAVVAIGCGLPDLKVSATSDVVLDISDPPYLRPLCGRLFDDPVRTCRRLLAVAVSGAVAESMFVGASGYGNAPERVSAAIATRGWRLVVSRDGDGRDAGAHAAALGQWARVREKDLFDFMQVVVCSHEKLVKRLLRLNWQRVATVAEALLRSATGKLTGDEIAKVVGR